MERTKTQQIVNKKPNANNVASKPMLQCYPSKSDVGRKKHIKQQGNNILYGQACFGQMPENLKRKTFYQFCEIAITNCTM